MKTVLKKLLKLPEATNVIGIIVISLIIWLIGPHIHFGGSTPLASGGARLFVIGLLVFGLITKVVTKLIMQHRSQLVPHLLKQMQTFKQSSKTGYSQLKLRTQSNLEYMKDRFNEDKHRRHMRKLPWYLVLGSPQSGKKTAIANSGLHFLQPEQFGKEAILNINTFPDYEWWFTNDAVLIDIATYDKEADNAINKKFIRYLRKHRRNKPISGVILSFTLSDLLLVSHANRQQFLNQITSQIRELHQTLKTQIPIYIVFTKCDMVNGFVEFFNDLSKEELAQVWGMTLPLKDCTDLNAVLAIFNNEYSQLMVRLQQRVLWSLDAEKNVNERELINAFPQQMQLFKKPISTFISELFGATRYYDAIQCRGIYFTSAAQVNNPHDFLSHALGKNYQIKPLVKNRIAKQQECYFVSQLFHEVMFPESNILGYSHRAKKLKNGLIVAFA
jgi:type VI secretion system protein ImpL